MSVRTVCLVGPLPPPAGGMANQTRDLAAALAREGVEVSIVRTNGPPRPALIARLPVLRAVSRFVLFVAALLRVPRRTQVAHVMANSGLSWHLLATPAVWLLTLRGVPVVLNYRGGQAAEFFQQRWRIVAVTLRRCTTVVVPSPFLQSVFSRYGVHAEIVPNFVSTAKVAPSRELETERPRLLVTRHLEPIYDVGTVLRAFAGVTERFPNAVLTVAGDGPQRAELESLARDLGVATAVRFTGNVSNDEALRLLGESDVMLNASRVDNMPIALIEAMAHGVPIVSTNAGGIPYVVSHEETGLLVEVGEHAALAAAVIQILQDPALARRLRASALLRAAEFQWPAVRARWGAVYERAVARTRGSGAEAMTG
jgi:glycosyltransferase involved in cell wall biosynthesis